MKCAILIAGLTLMTLGVICGGIVLDALWLSAVILGAIYIELGIILRSTLKN